VAPIRRECFHLSRNSTRAASRREYFAGWLGDLRYSLRVLGSAKGLTLGMALILLLTVIAVLLLAMACINVACMLVAHGAARRQEVAIRISLGAGRWRLLRSTGCRACFGPPCHSASVSIDSVASCPKSRAATC
jgi:hypothetical protein